MLTRWVDFSNDCPHDWSPGRRERGDEKTRDYDHAVADPLRRVVGRSEGEVAQRGEDEEAYEHPQRAVDEYRATTVLLDHVQARECAAEVDSAEDDGCDV